MTCDFSLAHYRELLEAAKAGGYRFAGFDRAPEPGDLILRHDVDLSLEAALALAEVEAEAGAWSTWFLMTRSVFYNLASAEGDAGDRAPARARRTASAITRSGRTSTSTTASTPRRLAQPRPEYMTRAVDGAERDGAARSSTRDTTAPTRTSTGAAAARTRRSPAASSTGCSS